MIYEIRLAGLIVIPEGAACSMKPQRASVSRMRLAENSS